MRLGVMKSGGTAGQGDLCPGASAFAAIECQITTFCADDGAGDGESQAAAAGVFGARGFQSDEGFEHPFSIRRGDAGAAVANRKAELLWRIVNDKANGAGAIAPSILEQVLQCSL